MILSFGLAACGTTYAKITGIFAGIGTEQTDPFVYDNPLLNDNTITEYDYILQVDKSYLFGVTYLQSGGSIICSMNHKNVSLKYDEDVLEIVYSNNEGEAAFYNLTCKKEVEYTAVIIEVEEYTYTIIISAKTASPE